MAYHLHGNLILNNILLESNGSNLSVDGNLTLLSTNVNANITSDVVLSSNILNPGLIPQGLGTKINIRVISGTFAIGSPSASFSFPGQIIGMEGTISSGATSFPLVDGSTAGGVLYGVFIFPSKTLIQITRLPTTIAQTYKMIIYYT